MNYGTPANALKMHIIMLSKCLSPNIQHIFGKGAWFVKGQCRGESHCVVSFRGIGAEAGFRVIGTLENRRHWGPGYSE